MIQRILSVQKMYPGVVTPFNIGMHTAKMLYHMMLKDGVAPEPLNIDLKVTKRCNAHCEFCFADIGSGEELPVEAYSSLAKAFKKKKAFFITGGEPFLRADIYELFKAIKDEGHEVGAVTNSSLIKKEDYVKLKILDSLVLSVHGTKEVHDALLGVRSFDRAMQILHYLSRMKPRPYLLVNSVVNDGTRDKLGLLKQECRDADEFRVSNISFLLKEELKNHKSESRRRFGEEIVTTQYIAPDVPKKPEHIEGELYPDLTESEIVSWYSHKFITKRRCLYIHSSVFVAENGDVHPCQYYKYPVGNIKSQPLKEIWNSPKMRKFRREISAKLLPGCSRCCKLL
ncbi:MAG: radical SAM protein [Nanoarchaeota archaeon]|nr:radical SAM protein [Nanoarchaeota archaeon]